MQYLDQLAARVHSLERTRQPTIEEFQERMGEILRRFAGTSNSCGWSWTRCASSGSPTASSTTTCTRRAGPPASRRELDTVSPCHTLIIRISRRASRISR